MASMQNCEEYGVSLPTKEYHSFTRKGYFTHENHKYAQPCHLEETEYIPPKTYVNNKSPRVSKLRNILTEAISNITKENTIKKGESVELTLEIELVKTKMNGPTNSLVEVTIIQHSNSEEGSRKNKTNWNEINGDELVDMTSINNKSESINRQRWLKSAINNQNGEKSILNEIQNMNSDKNQCREFSRDGMTSFVVNNQNISDRDRRHNFFTVLPEEIIENGEFRKGYRRVSPNETDFKCVSSQQKQKLFTKHSTKNSSLVKKLSDTFFPTKKAEKNIAVKSALTALKSEVHNMKYEAEQNTSSTQNKGEKGAPVHNLGKLVSNILVDMMESSDSDKYQSLQYKSFFEHIDNKKKKHKYKTKKQRPFVKNTIASQSDTCIPHCCKEASNLKLKSSKSVSDCRVIKNTSIHTDSTVIQCNNTSMGDSMQINARKKNKTKEKKCQHLQKKNGRGDIGIYSSNKLNILKCLGKNRATHKNENTIYWNGEPIEINKEIKKRIELLILSELQNLALKEGMECDVTPLPSTDDSSTHMTNVKKMSSFMCELDISDAKIKKTMKNILSLGSKHNIKQSFENLKRITSKNRKSKAKDETTKMEQLAISQNGITENSNYDNYKMQCFETKPNEMPYQGNISTVPSNKKVDDQELKVKYLNLNMKSWSDESRNATTLKPNIEMESDLKTVIRADDKGKNYDDNVLSSGFIKRISSNDSTWNTFLSGEVSSEKRSSNHSNKIKTYFNKKSYKHFSSITSKEYESKVEIELDVQELELILKEAKDIHKASKILISTKCNNCKNYKYKKQKKFTGKNSPSYTNQLLLEASKKLEKYTKVKL